MQFLHLTQFILFSYFRICDELHLFYFRKMSILLSTSNKLGTVVVVGSIAALLLGPIIGDPGALGFSPLEASGNSDVITTTSHHSLLRMLSPQCFILFNLG